MAEDSLFELDPDWAEHWQGMPEFRQEDQKPYATINVQFRNKEDMREFLLRDGYPIDRKQSVWYPRAQIVNQSVKNAAPTIVAPNRYPVYVISKGRWKTPLTSNSLNKLGILHYVVIEEQEYDDYAAALGIYAKIIILPFSNLGQGSIPARNFVWEHAKDSGASRHWILDDNIDGFYRLHENLKTKVVDFNPFAHIEDFTDRYENVALSGMQYEFFADRRSAWAPFRLNTRIYSCILIKNDLPYRWRGRYNEDTDLSLRALKDGHCTVLFNSVLCKKMPTMTMGGGNTDELYAGAGRLAMAKSLVEQHPDCVTVTEKWGRAQHLVDYRRFKQNKLIRKPDVVAPENERADVDAAQAQVVEDAPESLELFDHVVLRNSETSEKTVTLTTDESGKIVERIVLKDGKISVDLTRDDIAKLPTHDGELVAPPPVTYVIDQPATAPPPRATEELESTSDDVPPAPLELLQQEYDASTPSLMGLLGAENTDEAEASAPTESLFHADEHRAALERPWMKIWRGMPEFTQGDLEAWKSVIIHFADHIDRKKFSELIDQPVYDSTKSLWYPKAEIGSISDKCFVTSEPVNPRYPVYIISKGRADSRQTSRALERIGVPYSIVIEPQEYDAYAAVIDPKKILVLPFSNLGQGSIPARNWVWEHSISVGAERHWILDDNIKSFYRLYKNFKTPVATGATFRAAEDFSDRYENVVISGMQYFMFAPRKSGDIKPYTLNTRVYSCILIKNSLNHRWRGRYNEDTDLSLRALKDGHCTVLFNAFLADKSTTLTMKGGNTDELYAGVNATVTDWLAHVETCPACKGVKDNVPRCSVGLDILMADGRWKMAKSLYDQHPDIVEISEKWGRYQHHVDYRGFQHNKLKLREDVVIPDGPNEYGMTLKMLGKEEKWTLRRPKSETTAPTVVKAPKAPPIIKPSESDDAPSDSAPSIFSLLGGGQVSADELLGAPDPLKIPPPPNGIITQFLGHEPPRRDDDFKPDELPSLDGISTIVLNAETTGFNWWQNDRPISWAISTLDRELVRFLPFGFTGGNLDPDTVKRWMEREVRGKHILNANTKFDVHHAREWGVDLEAQGCTFTDIQHYSALLDEYRKLHNLDELNKDFLNETGPRRIDESRMASHHAAEAAERARYQVTSVARLRDVMWPMLDAQDLQRVRQLEDDVIPVVCEMEKNAACVDRDLLRTWVKACKTEYDNTIREISREVGFPVNPDTNEDWRRLFEHYSIPITKFTEPSKQYPSGQPSFTDDYLETIEHPKVQLMRRAGKLASLRSKFLDAYDKVVGDDWKLRFALHQLRGDQFGTIRGRFSMSGGGKGQPKFGANLQQVFSVGGQREGFGFDDKDSSHDDEIYLIRKLFIPGAGSFLSVDAQAIEYRLAAHFANAKKLIAAYSENPMVDFHNVVMGFIEKYRPISRKGTKQFNFLEIYGGGLDKAARTLKITRAEAEQLDRVYNREFPEFKIMRNSMTNKAETERVVTTVLGRRARFPEGSLWCHAAVNYVIQGSAADIMKRKLVELHNERAYTQLIMRGTVHDEVFGDSLTPETPARVTEVLNRQTFDLKVPIMWVASTGANWAECK